MGNEGGKKKGWFPSFGQPRGSRRADLTDSTWQGSRDALADELNRLMDEENLPAATASILMQHNVSRIADLPKDVQEYLKQQGDE